MNIVNLTDHIIIIEDDDAGKVLFPSGTVVRCKMKRRLIGKVSGVPVCQVYWEPAKGLPPMRKGTMYLVSQIVFDQTDRPDLLAPDTTRGSVIKNENGKTMAVKRLRVKEGFEKTNKSCYINSNGGNK